MLFRILGEMPTTIFLVVNVVSWSSKRSITVTLDGVAFPS